MAGSYPDPPGLRMAYDRDGTVGASINLTTSGITTLSQANLVTINNESSDAYTWATGSVSGHSLRMAFIFPQTINLVGYVIVTSNIGTPGVLESSNDTTNGLDGSWSTIQSPWTNTTDTSLTRMRNNIILQSASAVKAIGFRYVAGTGVNPRTTPTIHIYGGPSASTDRLAFWHPTLDQALAPEALEWGNVYQGQIVSARQFRIKNLSATSTASTITISREALTDGGTQTTVAGITLSDDNVSYGATASITSLSPGAISSIKYVKYAPTTSATLGLRWARLNAVALGWT